MSSTPIPQCWQKANASPEFGSTCAVLLQGRSRSSPVIPRSWRFDLIAAKAITPGEATEAGGRAALTALETAADAAKRGEVDGIVFAPLNKHAMRLAGLAHEDELRYLQERFGVTGFVSEFNVTGALWTSRVTSHIPLREVADAITEKGVCAAVDIADRYLKAAGIAAPRIAVAGLNPHAGDGGSIGREEIDVIAPAVERSRAATASTPAVRCRPIRCFSPRAAAISTPWCRCITTRGRSR